ncbi:uncharacterized protein misp3 isoform X2 [Hippocampus zosterae]|uniref:uncharacterized protein misp3 isoform X2 n=1 Tax=Hippocampus zosterae TaxID=109293 RepID=UPI00223DD208|nr:uncharacterized protein misp3 isoform X2 [Hippocampus zosterae]
MATVSLQKQEGLFDSLDKQECPMQCAVDACLDSAVLDQKAPRAEPEDSIEMFQACRDQGQTRETLTEWVQAIQQPTSHEELDEFNLLIGQSGFQRDSSSLKVKVPEWPGDDDINTNNYSPDCHRDVQQFSPCEDASPAFSGRAPESITHQFPLVVCSPTFADEEEETNTCGSKSSDPTVDVIPLDSQQGELLPQGQHELPPKGTNQETAQQVLGQNSAPLSVVAMEPPNQGGAPCKGSVCVVTVRERQEDKAVQRTEGESETGEQDHSGPGGNQAVGREQGEGLVRSCEFSQIQEEERENNDSAEGPKLIKMESDSSDDSQSDSGLSADFSPRSTSNIPAASQETRPKETPIEREIRRAIEREHSLRRSRGLPNTSPEYVEIPLMKTVVNQSVAAKSEKFHSADRELAGKLMQHDIHEEVGREQDLVKLGKVPGFYDKGTVRQLKEKKQIFEAFQNRRESSLSMSSVSSSSSSSSSSGSSSQASTVRSSERRQSTEPVRGAYARSPPRGPGLSEGMSCQVIIMENNPSAPGQKLSPTNAEVDGLIGVDRQASYVLPSCSGGYNLEMEAEEMLPKENPFFKLRSLTNDIKVEQDIREAQEREKELRKQRINLYGGGGDGGRPVGMDRRNLQGSVLDSSNSSASGRNRHKAAPPARQSVGKFSMWPPAQDHEHTVNQQKVVQGSHSSRHKTPLVHLWESGLVNGHNLQDQ